MVFISNLSIIQIFFLTLNINLYFTSNNIKFDYTNSIIRPQAFGRLRPVVSLLGLINQLQPKRLQSSTYQQFTTSLRSQSTEV